MRNAYVGRSVVPDLGRVISREQAAIAGNRMAERSEGAPTIADAMMAAAHSRAFEMKYLRFMSVSFGR